MKAPIPAALMTLSSLPLLPIAANAAASTNALSVIHQPITKFYSNDGSYIHYDFLDLRFKEPSGDALDFRRRKRDLSGTGSKRSHHQCRDSNKQHQKQKIKGLGGVIGGVGGVAAGVKDTLDKLPHFIEKGWYHDHKFGVVIAKTENNQADNEFLVNVTFGTPPQSLQMVLDSGSAETWTYSPVCCYGNNHSWFDPNQSSTYSNHTIVNGTAIRAPPGTPGQNFSIAYSSGTATRGYVGIDTIGFQNGKFKVADLPVALATNLTGSRRGRQMDGLLGLATGNGTLVEGGWTTAFEAMSQRGMLKETYLTASLVKSDRKTGLNGGGRYVFGEVDTSLLAGNVTWSKVLSAYFWAGYISKMNVGNAVLTEGKGNTTNPNRYIVDTGTATIAMPPPMARAANAKIHGSYKTTSKNVQLPWLVPCDTGLKKYESKLAKADRNIPLQIAFENVTFSMPIEDYVFFPQYPVPAAEAGGRENMCYSSIQEGLPSVSVIGLAWIKNHVIVFDQGGPTLANRRVGFGKRKDVKYDI